MKPQLTRREMIEERLYELERALLLDPDKEYRRELIREYLALTEPKLIDEKFQLTAGLVP